MFSFDLRVSVLLPGYFAKTSKEMKNVELRPSVHQEDLKHIEVKCFALGNFDPKYRVMGKGIPGGSSQESS